MNPLLGAAAISAGSSLLGGLFGKKSNDNTNQTNLQIARETNAANAEQLRQQQAFQRSMWQDEMNWNLAQWYRQNEYNDPKAMLQRFANAGINPYFALGNMSASTASQLQTSSPSSPSANPMQGATMQSSAPYIQSALSGVANSVNSYFNNSLLSSQRDKLNADTSRILQLTPHEVANLQAQSKKTGLEGQIARNQLNYLTSTFQERVIQSVNTSKLQERQIKLADADYQLKQADFQLKLIEQKYAPQLKHAELVRLQRLSQQITAEIGLINANTLKTKAETETELQRKLGIIIDNGLKGIDYDVQKSLKRDLMDTQYLLLQEELRGKIFERRKGKGTWLGSDLWHALTFGQSPY